MVPVDIAYGLMKVIYMDGADDQWGRDSKAKTAVSRPEVSGSVQVWPIPGVFVCVHQCPAKERRWQGVLQSRSGPGHNTMAMHN